MMRSQAQDSRACSTKDRPPRALCARTTRSIIAFALSLTFIVGILGRAEARPPEEGDFIEYSWSRRIGSGWGEYEDYTENVDSKGRLTFLDVNATHAQVRSAYSWSSRSSEGERRQGTVDRAVEFSLSTRRWTSALTDDDDHDNQPASDFTVWFWIPADGLQVGDRVHVLDDVFTVASLRATVWSSNLPRIGIELRASGTFTRDDVYGRYSVSYVDTYYYDARTGYVIAERYEERDSGTWQGRQAGFTWTETVDVTGSSYVIETDYPALALVILEVGGVIGLVPLGVYAWVRRPVYVAVSGMGPVKVHGLSRLPKLPEVSKSFPPSDHFGAFLRDFAAKALMAGDRVAVARHGDFLVGLATKSRETGVGQVFARDTRLAEALRHRVRAKDFFSEFRHQISPQDLALAAEEDGIRPSVPEAYNILGRYHVLRLDAVPRVGYDTAVVDRMRDEDLSAVAAVAKQVYGAGSVRWARAQRLSGDMGFVARLDRQIVGFAFASLVAGIGRLHTLTVLPQHRNRGIGRELTRARLRALHLLGARVAIMEVSESNLPSLQLAHAHGFAKVGTLLVETVRTRPVRLRALRR